MLIVSTIIGITDNFLYLTVAIMQPSHFWKPLNHKKRQNFTPSFNGQKNAFTLSFVIQNAYLRFIIAWHKIKGTFTLSVNVSIVRDQKKTNDIRVMNWHVPGPLGVKISSHLTQSLDDTGWSLCFNGILKGPQARISEVWSDVDHTQSYKN